MNGRPALMLGAVALGGLGAFGTPQLLRHVPFFRVRQVELVGVRYLAPDDVLDALALPADLNVFDSKRAIERRATSIPGITEARVERRLPGTLRIGLRMREPVAFASGPEGFVVLDADARPLPYNPTRNDIDLPVVERADPALTATLVVLRSVDPDFYDKVEYVRRIGVGVVVTLESHRVFFDAVPTVTAIESVTAVRRHLDSTHQAYEELDARFGGWVVVRGPAG